MQLPHPKQDAHKYSRGTVCIVGGSATYPGAAILATNAARAAQRAGSGYTRLFTCNQNVGLIAVSYPSLVVCAWDAQSGFVLPEHTAAKPATVVVGPGFDADDAHARSALAQCLDISAPVVIDGGALSMIANDDDLYAAVIQRAKNDFLTVLCPHAGEAKKLATRLTLPIADNMQLARSLAQLYQSTIILKGPTTFISSIDSIVTMDKGTPALAKAGTGDVLAGIVGAFVAQMQDSFDACVTATELHALAGKIAAEKLGDISVIPEDVISCIPQACLMLEKEQKELS